MRKPALLAISLLVAACAADQPYAPVRDVRYSALGEAPFWMVTIGDDKILLTLAPDGGGRRARLRSHAYPRVLPHSDGDIRRWESGDGTAVIAVEARPGPCTASRGATYADHVRVRLSGRELQGCGGRLLSGRRR
jgi:uncharacterized membrane protein